MFVNYYYHQIIHKGGIGWQKNSFYENLLGYQRCWGPECCKFGAKLW